MDTGFVLPPYRSFWERDDAWDLVVKVKYNGTLKRFNAHVNGSHFDHNLAALRPKIASAFKFSSDVEFILTYIDEDEDVVMLDDRNDLHDAVINQKLNPLRINVQLKNSNSEVLRTKHQASDSKSLRSIALEDQLAHVKSAIDEAMKFVPEQVPSVLAKLSHDLRSRAASSVPSLAELLDRLATLMAPKGNVQASSGHVYGSSCSASGGPQASRNTKIEHENLLMTGSASQSPEKNALGLKSVLPEDPKAQVEQAVVYQSVDSLKSTSSGGKKSDRKGSTVTESKVRCASQSKGKSTTSSAVPSVSSSTYAAARAQFTPAPSVGENKLRFWPTHEHNGLLSNSMQSRGGPIIPSYYPHLGSIGNTDGLYQWQPPFSFPTTNSCSPPKLDMPSSVGTYVPSKDGLYRFETSYKYNVPSSVTNNRNDKFSFGHSYNYKGIPQGVFHKWIQCDGCGATPIVGRRYKSNVKDGYDLCGTCYSLMGNESEYTRLDKPASVNDRELLGQLQQGELKLECSFIRDITIPDGTSMAPSNLFTKIWRLRNSGYAVWPFGTRVIWVGGDQFAIQSSVKLGMSVNGVAAGHEVDIAVDFMSPVKPGRYISYWRLALPSGKKFGQRIWVHIQVEEPVQTSGKKLSAATNLNLPPAANNTTLKPSIDMNSGSRNAFSQYPLSIYNEMPSRYHDSIVNLECESEPDSPTAPNFQYLNYSEAFEHFRKPIMINEPQSASSTLPSIPAAVKQVKIPTTDHHASSVGPALTSAAAVHAPETIPLPKSVSFAVPQSASSVPAPDSLPVQTSTTVPTSVLLDETINHKEEKLLKELEELGFEQVELNKYILQWNNYDLEESVRELRSLGDWDPLLGELPELDFNDAEMKKEAVAEGVKGLVMNLVARAKKDQ